MSTELRDTPYSKTFSYNANFDAGLANGQTDTRTLQIESDSDFEIGQLSATCTLTGGDNSTNTYGDNRFPGILCVIKDGATQAPLSNIPVPLSAIFGNGKKPRLLPQKRIVLANSVLVFTLSNIYSTTDGDMSSVVLTLQGRKIFKGAV